MSPLNLKLLRLSDFEQNRRHGTDRRTDGQTDIEDGRRAACLEGSHNKLCARTTKGCIERVVLCVGCGAKSAKDDSTFATTSGETGVR